MAIKLGQSLRMQQNLMMTPQLQQAIKLLTLTHLELTNVIAQEMVENPMLEELQEGDSMVEATDKGGEELQRLESENVELRPENFEQPALKKDDFDWQNYLEGYNSYSYSPPSMATSDPDDAPNYENIVSKGMTLADHLEWQLRMENLSTEQWELADMIIHNVNDDGRLEIAFDELIAQCKLNREEAFDVLYMVQRLDPVGCAAQNLKDCLLAQARILGEGSPLLELLIDNHLEDLQRKDYEKIHKISGISVDKIKAAEEILHSFHPKPGRLVSPGETQYIVPDIYVVEVGGKFVVRVNDDGIPRLRVSQLYQHLLGKSSNGDAKAKEYVQEKLKSALWLIKSIQNRQKTIIKVADAIVAQQQEFFRKGAQFLRPMVLRDIAGEIGMHESTVSRVTTNKYMHTPMGLFELKYFFNSGLGGKNGSVDISSEALKLKIKALVTNENPKRPLSDQKLAELLSRDDVVIARRTVAKYREMLDIASSAQRKRN
ncbi:MAG: RNA polymerase factor sigma-54 [Pseudomonadota bacterium]